MRCDADLYLLPSNGRRTRRGTVAEGRGIIKRGCRAWENVVNLIIGWAMTDDSLPVLLFSHRTHMWWCGGGGGGGGGGGEDRDDKTTAVRSTWKEYFRSAFATERE
jgi:hypothetical protein